MVFIKGQKKTNEDLQRTIEARRGKYGEGVCDYCGAKIDLYSEKQTTCGNYECKKKLDKEKYRVLTNGDPIIYKARTLSSTIRAGKGKQKIMENFLRENLGKPCKYCERIITLENASIDHKIPRINSKVYNRKTKKMTYTAQELRQIDSLDNLQIICRECNFLKNDFTDNQYIRLAKFIRENEDIGIKLRARLNRSIRLYKN